MLNQGRSDALPDEPRGGFRPSGRQIGGGIVTLLLVIFIAANSTSVSVNLIFTDATFPLWLILAITTLLGFGVGMLFGSRRTKAKMVRRG